MQLILFQVTTTAILKREESLVSLTISYFYHFTIICILNYLKHLGLTTEVHFVCSSVVCDCSHLRIKLSASFTGGRSALGCVCVKLGIGSLDVGIRFTPNASPAGTQTFNLINVDVVVHLLDQTG